MSSIIVVLEIVFALKLPFIETMLGVMIPMFIIECVIGYTLFSILSKNKGFLRIIGCERKELLNELKVDKEEKSEDEVQSD